MRRLATFDEDLYEDEIRPGDTAQSSLTASSVNSIGSTSGRHWGKVSNYVDEVKLSRRWLTAPHEHDVAVGRPSPSRASSQRSTVVPMVSNVDDDDTDDVDALLKSIDDDNSSNGVGEVGLKWRVRVVRVLDAEEQWKGICELYFHWGTDGTVDKSRMRSRHKSNSMTEREKHTIVNINKPERSPIFVILNEEDSNSIEEMYYTLPGYPGMYFGYLAWTVVVHERLELERYPYDRQFFKLEIECTNGLLMKWFFHHVPSLVFERISIGDLDCSFFALSNSPSWKMEKLYVVRGSRESVLKMCIGLSRLSGFYVCNIGLPCFMIGIAAALTAAIEPSDYGNRFECMIALYLTLVAIKFVASYLPAISYSTLLDYYTLIAYMFLAGWMIENFAVSPMFFGETNQDRAKVIDRHCVYAYVALWVALHALILFGSKHEYFRKSWEEVQKDDEKVDPSTHKEQIEPNS